MTKHLSIQKILAALLTIAALASGLTAQATVQAGIMMQGLARTVNNQTMCTFVIQSNWGGDQIPDQTGSSYTFSNARMIHGTVDVTLNGTLNFQEGTSFADVITGSSFTVTITSSSLWFYGATVQTKSGTDVSGCSTTVSSNNHTLTVTIPTNKTFGAIIVDYVANPPMTNSNTTVTVPQGDYWVSNSSHKPQPEPTVVYVQTTLVKDTDYTLSWSNNSSAGTGTVTVTGIGNYAGSATGTFPIRWARYYVHFDKNHNDATGTMSDQLFTYNTAQALTANTFSRAGYSFAGWSTTSNGAVTYTDGQSVNNLTAEDGQTVTLYAQWTPITYNITYDLAGGSVATANPTTYNIETATFTLNNPTRVLSTFAGWTGTGLEEPTMNVTIEQGSTGDRSYTATWTLIPVTYIDADGNQQTCTDFTIIESSENNVGLGTGGQDCWYVVSGNVTINGQLFLRGFNSHLILCDGATLNIHHTNDIHGLYGYDLIIYGQSIGNGTLTASAPWAGIHTDSGLTINGGIISATSTTTNGISVGHDITINRGSVTAHGHYHGMSGRNVIINGGIVNATNGEGNDSYGIIADLDITLGYTKPTDRIAASSYKSDDGTISVKAGQTLYDGTEAVYSGTLNSTQIDAIAGKTLEPCFSITLPEHVNATGVIRQEGTIAYALAGADITLTYGGELPEHTMIVYSVNGNDIEGDTFQMPYDNATVTATITKARYTFDSTTGELALLWGDFNRYNKWGSEVTASAVTSVTATDEVSFTGDCSYLFENFVNCTSMDLTDVNTANVTNMYGMFRNCSGLPSLDLSGWNTDKVTNMSIMFSDCSDLQSLDLSGWNTDKVTNMSIMFSGCSGLQSLNISGWNTANVTNMSRMFQDCSSLQSLDLSGWNTAKVVNMSYMFQNCSGLQSLNISGWNTANVSDMSHMFEGCSGFQSLNISGWNTANVSDMSHMFQNCTNLVTIYVGEGWNTLHANHYSSNMFTNCTSLVGGMGTAYNAYYQTNVHYAHIDGGPGNPGYFTEPFTKEIAGYEDNESGWYLIASPLAADIAPTAVTNMTNETFDLYCFDQTGGTNGKEWKNYKAHTSDFVLENGQGYLYANSGDVTLMFADTPYNGDGKVNLTYSTDNPNATMHGWNLIGNPFSTNATIGNTPFYRMNAAGSEIIAADVNDNTVNPMEGIFVKATQANQTVTFVTTMTRGNANSNSAALVMDISQNRGGVIDRAIVRFDEGQTLPKFQIHENSTKIYIPQDGMDYAIAVIASDSEAIQPTEHPVNFKASENGTYTLTISPTLNSQLSTLNYLHLIDNMTGADVDLLRVGDCGSVPAMTTEGKGYTFTAKTTDYESRFKLVFAVGSSTGSDTFAFIDASGNLIVNGEGTLQVFDVLGHQLVTKQLSTLNSQLSTLNYAPGVYVLRLINGENVRTQKIVVR